MHKFSEGSFFRSVLARFRRAKTEGKKEAEVGGRFTPGRGLGGLARGYSLAAPSGAPEAT